MDNHGKLGSSEGEVYERVYLKVGGCFHFNADEKKTYFKSCEYCDNLEKIGSHYVCGIVKYNGVKYAEKKT